MAKQQRAASESKASVGRLLKPLVCPCRAQAAGLADLGCLLAALLTERDPLRGRSVGADAGLRIAALIGEAPSGSDVDLEVARRVTMAARQLAGQLAALRSQDAVDEMAAGADPRLATSNAAQSRSPWGLRRLPAMQIGPSVTYQRRRCWGCCSPWRTRSALRRNDPAQTPRRRSFLHLAAVPACLVTLQPWDSAWHVACPAA